MDEANIGEELLTAIHEMGHIFGIWDHYATPTEPNFGTNKKIPMIIASIAFMAKIKKTNLSFQNARFVKAAVIKLLRIVLRIWTIDVRRCHH